MKPFSLPIARVLAALVVGIVSTTLAGPVAAEPPITVCTPDGGVCVAADATAVRQCEDGAACAQGALDARACTAEVCTAVDARACRPRDCTAAAATLCAQTGCTVVALGGIEKPAVGQIVINGPSNGPATMTLTGVYDPAAGFFACTLTDNGSDPVTVSCVSISLSYDWYCAGWIVSATANTWTGQAAGKASCLGPASQSLQTGIANFGSPQTAQALGLSWFADTIVCEASGYSAGPHPMGAYTVTCNEPGYNAPR